MHCLIIGQFLSALEYGIEILTRIRKEEQLHNYAILMDGGPYKILSNMGHLPQLLIGYMNLLNIALIYVTFHYVNSGCKSYVNVNSFTASW